MMPMTSADLASIKVQKLKVEEAYEAYKGLKREVEGRKTEEDSIDKAYAENRKNDDVYKNKIRALLKKREELISLSKTLNNKIAKFEYEDTNIKSLLQDVAIILEKPPIDMKIRLYQKEVTGSYEPWITTHPAKGEQDPEYTEHHEGGHTYKITNYFSFFSGEKNRNLQAEGGSFAAKLKETATKIERRQLDNLLDELVSTERGLEVRYRADKSSSSTSPNRARISQIKEIQKELKFIKEHKPNTGNKEADDAQLAILTRGCLLKHKEALGINLNSSLAGILTEVLDYESIKKGKTIDNDSKEQYEVWEINNNPIKQEPIRNLLEKYSKPNALQNLYTQKPPPGTGGLMSLLKLHKHKSASQSNPDTTLETVAKDLERIMALYNDALKKKVNFARGQELLNYPKMIRGCLLQRQEETKDPIVKQVLADLLKDPAIKGTGSAKEKKEDLVIFSAHPNYIEWEAGQGRGTRSDSKIQPS